MRFLLGIIAGCALTILTAYIVDNRGAINGTTVAVERQMVNWDVVSANWQRFSERVRGEWRKLAG